VSAKNQFALLGQRRFGPFFLTQFLGAFNDNVFKNALVILLAFQAGSAAGLDASVLVNIAAGLFILPFFLFSATFGQLADKYEKSRLMRLAKALEIGVMLLGVAGFYLDSLPLLFTALFLMGTQSTLFGPAKYGILPQHLHETELVGGNGLVETGTFLAILLGTMAGGVLIGLQDIGLLSVSATILAVAVLGFLASLGIPAAPATDPELKINWNPVTETWRNVRFASGNRTVFLSILGVSWFWFFGATYLTQLPVYTKENLGGTAEVVTLLLTLFSLGVGVGSLLCERLSGHKVEIGLVPFGSIGMTVFSIDLFFAVPGQATGALVDIAGFLQQPWGWRVIWDVVLLGMFGGFYIVPLYALIQQRSEPSHRSRIIACNNILNAAFMVLAAAVAVGLLKAGLNIPQLFLVTALFNAAVALFIYKLVPEFLVRFMIWLLMHTMYRLRSRGLEQIPEDGPCVLVCNHVSFVDALIVGGSVRRPARLFTYHKVFHTPLLFWFFRTVKAIPIAGMKEDPEMMEQAFERVSQCLKDGEVVMIFPEGALTPDGEIAPFRTGIERILQRDPVPVIPMALRGVWGSFFSRAHGPAMLKFPRRFWSKIELVVGDPVPPEAVTAAGLQQKVAELRGDWR
jgi:1-acyl-sn-glycerol-3-phosphate acyltransferase